MLGEPQASGGPIILISCSATKREYPAPARELYASPLFMSARQFAEGSDGAWFILSAKHGLVAPDKVLEPYDVTLNKMPDRDRRAWAVEVFKDLKPLLNRQSRVVFLAGEKYRQHLLPLIESIATVEIPLKGLSIGKQLQWFARRRNRAQGELL